MESAAREDGRQGFMILVNVAHPKSRGTIRLKNTDPFEPPLIDPNYFEHPYDVDLTIKGIDLSHNNPCFQCNIAITNFLISHTYDKIFHDVIGQSTAHMYSYARSPKYG